MTKRRWALIGLGSSLVAFCITAIIGEYPPCWGYADWQTAAYVLPYPIGKSYPVYQGNCTLGGHHGVYQYSYDFLMPIGTLVTAARAGVVVAIEAGFRDGDPAENWVAIQHDDGTVASYSHLHSLVAYLGDQIAAGDPIGLSGNTGQTGGVPHLHFHVSACIQPKDCGTLPVTFSNTDPNPSGLIEGLSYLAK